MDNPQESFKNSIELAEPNWERLSRLVLIGNPGDQDEKNSIFGDSSKKEYIEWQHIIFNINQQKIEIPLCVIPYTAAELSDATNRQTLKQNRDKAIASMKKLIQGQRTKDQGRMVYLFGGSTKYGLEKCKNQKDIFIDGNPETTETIIEQLKKLLDFDQQTLVLGASSKVISEFLKRPPQELKKDKIILVYRSGSPRPNGLDDYKNFIEFDTKIDKTLLEKNGFTNIPQIINGVHLPLLNQEVISFLGVKTILEIARPIQYEVEENAHYTNQQLGTWILPENASWESPIADIGNRGVYACFAAGIVKAAFGDTATSKLFLQLARKIGLKLEYVNS